MPPTRRSSASTSSFTANIGRRPALADRAFPDRRPGRHPAPRAGRDHRLDAADAPDQRPADGRKAARPEPACGRLCVAVGAQDRARSWPSVRTFPVESPNPFPGLSAAISRQDINGQPPGGWIPSERLTFAQALDAYTRGAAYAGSPRTGSARSNPANGPISSSSTAIRPRSTRRAWRGRRCSRPGSRGRRCGSARLALQRD